MTARGRIAGLYAIADTDVLAPANLVPAVRAAIEGGAALVQYRDKAAHHAAARREVEALRALCRQRALPFIVNDDIELALALGADGVHLGRDDAAIDAARRRLGPNAIIGVSCYDELDRALAAERAGADYVAFGSFYPSPTKPQAVRPPLSLLTQARTRLRVPIVAIGGITPENGAHLIAAGADALAVIGALFHAPDIAAQARRYAALYPLHDT